MFVYVFTGILIKLWLFLLKYSVIEEKDHQTHICSIRKKWIDSKRKGKCLNFSPIISHCIYEYFKWCLWKHWRELLVSPSPCVACGIFVHLKCSSVPHLASLCIKCTSKQHPLKEQFQAACKRLISCAFFLFLRNKDHKCEMKHNREALECRSEGRICIGYTSAQMVGNLKSTRVLRPLAPQVSKRI